MRILLIGAFVLFLLPLLVAALLLIPAVQQWTVGHLTEFASEAIGSRVVIGEFYLKPFSTLSIKHTLVMDRQNDTLLYAGSFEVEIQGYNWDERRLNLSKVKLSDATFNLQIPQGDSLLNLTRLLEAFNRNEADSGNADFVVSCSNLWLTNCFFTYHDFNSAPAPLPEMDFNHLEISNCNASLRNTLADVNGVHSEIKALSFAEKSGFVLKHLSTEASVKGEGITCKGIRLVSLNSELSGYFALNTRSWSSYGHFADSVVFDVELRESQVHPDDLAHFAPPLLGTFVPFRISGAIQGPLADLHANLDSLVFSDNGFVSGTVAVKGLPAVSSMYISADIARAYATIRDLGQIRLGAHSPNHRLQLPMELERLGFIDFSGKISGLLSDFKTNASLSTLAGTLRLDASFTSSNDQWYYRGNISSNALYPATSFVDVPLGKLAFRLEVDGSGFRLNELDATATGKIEHLDLLGYAYKSIDLDGRFRQRIFTGSLTVNDSNLVLSFDGKLDMSGTIPSVEASTNIKRLKLSPLGLLASDTFGILSTKAYLSISGDDLRQLQGEVFLTDLSYSGTLGELRFDTVSLVDQFENGFHFINLRSDLIDAEIAGKTNLFDLHTSVLQLSQAYAPYFTGDVDLAERDTTQRYKFSILVKGRHQLLKQVIPELRLPPRLKFSGRVNTVVDEFVLTMDTSSFSYANLHVRKLGMQIAPVSGRLEMSALADKLSFSDEFFLENFSSKAYLVNDSLTTVFTWHNYTEQADSGGFSITTYATADESIHAVLNALEVRIAGVFWKAKRKPSLHIEKEVISIRDLLIESKNGYISGNGILGYQPRQHLLFQVKHFNLAYLSSFGFLDWKINGVLDATIDLHYKDSTLIGESAVDIDSLVIDGLYVGNLGGNSAYDNVERAVEVNLDLDYRDKKNIGITGYYFPFRRKDQLDFDIDLKQFRLAVIEPFIGEYASNISGLANGRLNVNGTLDTVQVSGLVTLSEADVTINYLNTHYHLPLVDVIVEPDMIAVNAVEVYDDKKSKALLTFTLFHEGFNDLNYDLFVEATNFLCLNTTLAQNQDYYGTANITGDISISGDPNMTVIEVDASTDPNSKLIIPLSGPEDVSQLGYIRFVATDDTTTKQNENIYLEEASALLLDFRLTVDQDAEIQLVFDQKIGDIIKVVGEGNMLLQIDTRGKFNMYGDYIISNGDYLFTLQNVVNKRFTVQPGSRIQWNGSPYDAKVDLTAIYKLRASPANLVYPDTSEVYQKRMPVEVSLIMSGRLLEPTIRFDVDITSLPETDLANQLLEPRLISEEEMNKQAFSLLLANNFAVPGSSGLAIGGAGQTTTYEMLSNQFSNWISQYFDEWDVGVNFRPGDGANTDQGEISISRELFNDRVLVEVNGTVQGNSGTSDASNNVAGEFNIEYKINKDGSLRARVFNEANNYNPTNINQSPYTQGAGVFYRKEFDTWSEFFRQLTGTDKSRKEE
ncbi:MAG: translocation/assembly module TamB domain-containing protein [Salibacteraceae bacterium]